jgi:cyclopropane fatty-acyl-phospholipid synthase-like methyltransferase
VTDSRIETVARGYDEIADSFAEWAAQIEDDPRRRFRDELSARLADGARVLELGCGAGSTLARLAERFDVTGTDLSREQLRRAAERVPDATLLHGDLTSLELPPASFDAVASFYVLGHVPRERHATVYRLVSEWLVPGGLFLANMGVSDDPGTVEDWVGGAPMYFSSWPPETTRRLLAEVGFELLLDALETTHEPEGDSVFQWVLARR